MTCTNLNVPIHSRGGCFKIIAWTKRRKLLKLNINKTRKLKIHNATFFHYVLMQDLPALVEEHPCCLKSSKQLQKTPKKYQR